MLVGCGDPPGGTATGAMSGSSADSGGSDGGATEDVTTSGAGGSASAGTLESASGTGDGTSATGGSGTGASGTSGAETSPDDTGEPPGIAENCAAGELAAVEVDLFTCGCDVEAGLFETVEDCLAVLGQGLIVPGCSCGVYAQHPEEAGFIACYAEAVTSFAQCLGKMTCVDEPGQMLCAKLYFGALEACGAPMKSTVAALEIACHGVAPMECGSGEQIPYTWACDGEPDCADMSDEACVVKCADGIGVVDKSDLCDGEPDCADNSDEKGCR